MFLLYLQQGVTIIRRNSMANQSLAPEKLCTVVFGTDRLKITVLRHEACCVRLDYTSNLWPCALDCIRLAASSLGLIPLISAFIGRDILYQLIINKKNQKIAPTNLDFNKTWLTDATFVFIRKKQFDNPLNVSQIFAQATSLKLLDQASQASRCWINTKETGSISKRQTLEWSHKWSATTRESAEIKRSWGENIGTTTVSRILNIASFAGVESW